MKVAEIKTKASDMGIKAGKLSKQDLIRQIQTKEGYKPCFNTGINNCDQLNCSWRSDCIK